MAYECFWAVWFCEWDFGVEVGYPSSSSSEINLSSRPRKQLASTRKYWWTKIFEINRNHSFDQKCKFYFSDFFGFMAGWRIKIVNRLL